MTAVLGGDRDEVLAAIERHGLTAANDNGAGQVVAAGTLEQLAALADEPPAKAADHAAVRRRRLPHRAHGSGRRPAGVAGRSVSAHDPRTPLISNRDGQVVHDRREVLRRIVGQIANPVRWDLCLDTMRDLGVTGILEMPPAGTLTGIAKRALKGVETFALKTPDQLDDARDFVDKHGEASMIETTPTWRMVVSPAKGTFHRPPRPSAPTCSSPAATRRRRQPARPHRRPAAHGGSVVEWLVEDGDLVSPASRCCACTRRAPRDGAITATTGARTRASWAWAPTAPPAWSPTPRSSTRSTPATSGSSSARASRPVAGPVPTSRSR